MKLLEVKLKRIKKLLCCHIKVKYYRFVFVSEKQTIDFEELTNAGLFGIFGAGSGKSVLEAIGFVLYGDTERLNKTERSYNMLNLKSDKANIEFEFLNFEERKFKFVTDWKRKKRFEETTSIERLAYEWKGRNGFQ
jgi:exonuclease SbcC